MQKTVVLEGQDMGFAAVVEEASTPHGSSSSAALNHEKVVC